MPALHVFGTRWEASTDSFSIYALVLLLYHVIWLFMYWIGIVAFTAPSRCPVGPTNPQEYVITYLMLFVYIVWAIMAAAMLVISLRGTPLESSKRRWLVPLIYTYFISWIPGFGVLGYAIYVLYGAGDTCWSKGDISMIALMVFGALGIMAGIAFSLLTTHILFGEVRPGIAWHAVKKGISTCVGVYTWMLCKHRGPVPPLEELATEFLDRQANVLDLDKTDVVTALVCARLVQRERRERLMKARLEAAGQLTSGVQEPSLQTETPIDCTASGSTSVISSGSNGRVHPESKLSTACEAASGGGQEKLGTGKDGMEDAEVMQWVKSVCQGSGVCLTPSSTALQLAPHLSARQAADICTDSLGVVDESTLCDVLHWARFAAAAYGKQGYLWTVEERSVWAARRTVARLAKQAQRSGKLQSQRMKSPDTGEKLKPIRLPAKLARDFVAAGEMLGLGDDDIIHMSPEDKDGRRLGYFVALDRERQCVVLSVSGKQHYAPMAGELTTLPPDWEPEATKGSTHVVHAGALAAAQQLLAELETHGTLFSLLPPSAAQSPSTGVKHSCVTVPAQQQMGIAACKAGGQTTQQGELPAMKLDVAEANGGHAGIAAVSDGVAGRDKGSGWSLVLTGHGQGAGAAVLLGLGLLPRYPGLKVWAFEPQGGLCDPALSRALQSTVVTVILGKDAVPRTAADTIATLVEEGLVGLARFRYSKAMMLVAMLAEKAGPRSWRGKWLNHSRALRRPEDIPPEALQYLARFCLAKQAAEETQQTQQTFSTRLGATQPSDGEHYGHASKSSLPTLSTCPPGRVLYFRRLKSLPAQQGTAQHAQQQCADDLATQQGLACDGTARRMEAGSVKSGQGEEQLGSPGCCDGCCGGCIPLKAAICKDKKRRVSSKEWDAVWVSPEAVVREGILVSKRSMHDHFVSRLLSVAQRLA